MRKSGNIVSYTAEELDAMCARGEDRTDWARVDAKTDAEIAADTASDPAWDGVPEDWVNKGRLVMGLIGGQKENKRQVTMRFDADILDFFKRGGRGWQGRMNAVLRSFVEGQHQKP
jgi:uncharacterized protein (DUF4415 family)